MAISKITLNGVTQMDVTQDTVDEENLLYGETATKANGTRTTGTVVIANVDATLSIAGDAADAKATGDGLADLKNAIGGIEFLQWTLNEVRNSWTLLTPTTKNGWGCAVIECSAGDVFSIKGYGGDNNRLWAFANSSGEAIILSDIIQTQDYIILTAPTNAAYFICNSDFTQTSYPASLIKGMPVDASIQDAKKVQLLFPEIMSGYSFDADDGGVRPTSGYTCYIYRVAAFAGGKVSGRTGVNPNSYGIGFKDANGSFISGTKNTNTGHYDWNYEINIPSNAETLYISLRDASSSLWVDPKCEYDVELNKLAEYPSAPTANGTYTLQCTVSGGTATYSWVSV